MAEPEAAARTGPASAAGPVPSRLRWLHLLVLLCLAGVGVAAGSAVFVVHDLGHWGEVQACVALVDLPPDGGQTAGLLGRGDEYDRCAAGFETTRELSLLGGVAVVSALAGAAVLLDGLSARRAAWRRVRRRPADEWAAAVVRERFDHWCDLLGLGHRRPRLVVAPIGVPQAYTTALPYGRPLVVVPAAQAYGRRDLLDLVLLHELAHVRARDVAWASATWWTGWLTLPVLLAAVMPALVRPGPLTRSHALTLPVTALLAAATLLLRAAVLRRREHAADRFAVDRADLRDALTNAAGDDDGRRPPRWAPGRLLARHPTGPERVRALDRDLHWEDGFTVAVVAGLGAMFTFQAMVRLSLSAPVLRGSAGDLALAVAALLWALLVVPLWSRRPASARRRWARVLGSGLGLAGGYVLPSYGATSSVYGVFLASFHPGAFALMLPALTGVGALAVGFAETLARAPTGIRRRMALATTVLAVAILLTAVLTTATLLVFGHWAWHSGPIDRALWSTPGTPARLSLLAVPVAALLLAAVARPARPGPPAAGSRRPGQLVVSVLLAGGTAVCAGVAATDLLAARTAGGDAFYLLFLRWWLCAAAGWSVATIVLLARGVRGTGVAWLAGATATAVAGVVQFGRDVLGGTGRSASHLLSFLERPAWLLTGALLFSLPLVLLLRELWTGWVRPEGLRLPPGGAGQAPVPVAAWVRQSRAGRPSWPVPVAAAAMTVAVTGVVALGWTAPVTGRAGDWDLLRSARVEPAAPDDGRRRPAALDPGRPLDRATIDAALAEARRSLPPGWTPAAGVGTFEVVDPAQVRPRSCAEPLAAESRAERTPVVDGTVTVAVPADTLPPLGASLRLRVTSYPSPDAAARVLVVARTAVADCPRWSVPSPLADGGSSHRWVLAMPRADLPYDSFRIRITESSTVGGLPAVVGGARVVVAVGRTVLSAEIAQGVPFRDQLTPKEKILLDDLAVVGTRLVVHALDS
ncbi:M48 family metalloprotease [Micromonospora matsumotoense]|uniref:M48 family metalloprotease n=1 Tax=Micromonospora matsumotoense TaxID=121616 RepID=UPI0033DE97DB